MSDRALAATVWTLNAVLLTVAAVCIAYADQLARAAIHVVAVIGGGVL